MADVVHTSGRELEPYFRRYAECAIITGRREAYELHIQEHADIVITMDIALNFVWSRKLVRQQGMQRR